MSQNFNVFLCAKNVNRLKNQFEQRKNLLSSFAILIQQRFNNEMKTLPQKFFVSLPLVANVDVIGSCDVDVVVVVVKFYIASGFDWTICLIESAQDEFF